MNVKRLLIFITFLLIVGCASQIPKVTARLEVTESCCKDFSEVTYQKLELGFSEEFRMENQPAFQFKSGKSFFKAFEVSHHHDLEIVTYVDGGYLPTAQIFWPSVMTLNKRYETVRELDKLSLRKGFQYFSPRGSNWGGKLELLENEKYILIYTKTGLFGQKKYVKSSGNAYAYSTESGSVVVPSTSATDHYSSYSPGGVIKINVAEP